jgi:hypothetical protein
VPSKHWKIETTALKLGEPVWRTQKRIDDGEQPLVVRKGERLVPTEAVHKLRERLLQEDPTYPRERSGERGPESTPATARHRWHHE